MLLPELLSPAGNLEKLKLAINYGADAVYLGLQKFGLRSAAENFSFGELAEGIEFAHARNAKVFIVLNAFLHDKELNELPSYLNKMESLGVDAVIVSDLGVIETVKKHSNIEIHLSTQASCLNTNSAKLWKDMGVRRIVFGREIGLEEAKKIKENVNIEIEMFIHGSMCMAYSGNCVISNYTQGRDSNRGGCAHSCRFNYSFDLPGTNTKESSYFMSSKDLNAIFHLGKFIEYGVDSLKVEGRMKNHLYLSTVTGAYRAALDEYKNKSSLSDDFLKELADELQKFAHRGYTDASLIKPAGSDSVYRDREHATNSHQVIGKVLKVEDGFTFFLSKAPLLKQSNLEIVNFENINQSMQLNEIYDINNNAIDKTKPNRIYKFKNNNSLVVTEGNVLRREI